MTGTDTEDIRNESKRQIDDASKERIRNITPGLEWEKEVQAMSGGHTTYYNYNKSTETYSQVLGDDKSKLRAVAQEVDSETETELIEAKDRAYSDLQKFRAGRNQLRRYQAIAKQFGKRFVIWFRNEPIPEIISYCEERGITVRIGQND